MYDIMIRKRVVYDGEIHRKHTHPRRFMCSMHWMIAPDTTGNNGVVSVCNAPIIVPMHVKYV